MGPPLGLDLPRYVRAEWATELGLDQFDPTAAAHSDFNRAEAAVKKRIGASTAGVVHNPSNQLLMDGSAKLGYVCDVTGQNFQDTKADTAGWSCFGDRYGNKQGTARTYHADAASNGVHSAWDLGVDRALPHFQAQALHPSFPSFPHFSPSARPFLLGCNTCRGLNV